MQKYFLSLLALATLAGCPKGDSDSDTGGTDTEETDTQVEEFAIDANWSAATQLDVTLVNSDATGFYFGIAQTSLASDVGWYGEACDPDNCHTVTGATGSFDSVDAVNDIVFDGTAQTTLFRDEDGNGQVYDNDGNYLVTYIVSLIGGADNNVCYAWGEDAGYYSDCEDITGLMP